MDARMFAQLEHRGEGHRRFVFSDDAVLPLDEGVRKTMEAEQRQVEEGLVSTSIRNLR